jgi:predicted RNase H-like HicB family nuclease
MVLSTEYPLDGAIRATNESERKLPSSPSSVIERVNAILGYDVSVVLVKRYAKSAVRYAQVKWLDSGEVFAEIQGFQGVWAKGDTEADALKELEEVVEDWVSLKIEDKDGDLPIVDGIDLNVL